MVHPGYPVCHRCEDFPRDRGASARQLGRRDARSVLRAEEHELVLEGRPPAAALTSAITASMATLPTSGTRRPRTRTDGTRRRTRATSRRRSRWAAWPARDRCAAVQRTAIADRLAGLQPLEADGARLERHGRPELGHDVGPRRIDREARRAAHRRAPGPAGPSRDWDRCPPPGRRSPPGGAAGPRRRPRGAPPRPPANRSSWRAEASASCELARWLHRPASSAPGVAAIEAAAAPAASGRKPARARPVSISRWNRRLASLIAAPGQARQAASVAASEPASAATSSTPDKAAAGAASGGMG